MMNYRNPIFNFDQTVNCEINHPIYGWIPFTASPDDVEAHGRELYAEILEAGDIAPYIITPPTIEELVASARDKRNSLLASSDWTQLPDVPEAIRLAWAEYRQALRDIPQQEGFPQTIVWPVAKINNE
jgi:hypothetical protein